MSQDESDIHSGAIDRAAQIAANYAMDATQKEHELRKEIERLTAELAQVRKEMGEARQNKEQIHILFDGPPSHISGRFIEVENDEGASINAGEWKERADGLWELVIQTDATECAESAESRNADLVKLIGQFDAAIRRIAAELTGKACGGVDTGDNINPETREPYGPGGHTGWLLAEEAKNLKAKNASLVARGAAMKNALIKIATGRCVEPRGLATDALVNLPAEAEKLVRLAEASKEYDTAISTLEKDHGRKDMELTQHSKLIPVRELARDL